jgi:hypothetical protein
VPLWKADGVPAADRIPGILRRYLATAPGDFAARHEPVGDLEEVLEEIVRDALDDGEALLPGASTDGVALESLSVADQTFHCEGNLWLLGGSGGSWSVPLKATFSLSDDLNSLRSCEVKIAEPKSDRTRARPGDWVIIARIAREEG